MSRHRRGRITVQSQPTGAAQGVRRGIGVVQAIFGFVFVVVAVTEIIPTAGLFGLPFWPSVVCSWSWASSPP